MLNNFAWSYILQAMTFQFAYLTTRILLSGQICKRRGCLQSSLKFLYSSQVSLKRLPTIHIVFYSNLIQWTSILIIVKDSMWVQCHISSYHQFYDYYQLHDYIILSFFDISYIVMLLQHNWLMMIVLQKHLCVRCPAGHLPDNLQPTCTGRHAVQYTGTTRPVASQPLKKADIPVPVPVYWVVVSINTRLAVCQPPIQQDSRYLLNHNQLFTEALQ